MLPSTLLTASRRSIRSVPLLAAFAAAASVLTAGAVFAEPPPLAYYAPPVAVEAAADDPGIIDKSNEMGMHITRHSTVIDGKSITVELRVPTGPYAYPVELPVTLTATSPTGAAPVDVKVCNDEDCSVVLASTTLNVRDALAPLSKEHVKELKVFPGRREIFLSLEGQFQTNRYRQRGVVTRDQNGWVVAVEGPGMDVISAGMVSGKQPQSQGFSSIRAVTFFDIFERHPNMVHGFNAIVFHPSTVVSPTLQAELEVFVKRGGVVIAGENLFPQSIRAGTWKAVKRTGELQRNASNVRLPAPNLDAAAMQKDEDGVWVRHAFQGLTAEQTTAALLSVRPEFSLIRVDTSFGEGATTDAARIGVHRFNSGLMAVFLAFLWMVSALLLLMKVRKQGTRVVILALGTFSFATTVVAFVGASFWRTSSEVKTVRLVERTVGHAHAFEIGTAAQRIGVWGTHSQLKVPTDAPVALLQARRSASLKSKHIDGAIDVESSNGENTVSAVWRRYDAAPKALTIVSHESQKNLTGTAPVLKNTSGVDLSFIGIFGPQGTRWKRSLSAGETLTYSSMVPHGRHFQLDNMSDDVAKSTLAARRFARDLSRKCDNSRGNHFDDYSCVVAVDISDLDNLVGYVVTGIGTDGGSK